MFTLCLESQINPCILQSPLQPKLLSYELLDLVSSHFNLKEKEFFGLAFFDDKYVNAYLYTVCVYVYAPQLSESLCPFTVVSVSGCRWTAEFWTTTFQRSLGPLPSASWSGNNGFSHTDHMLSGRGRHFFKESGP